MALLTRKKNEAIEHDYTRRYWGHDFTISMVLEGGRQIRGSIWGGPFREGDFLILPNGERSTRYVITNADHHYNTDDMYSFEADFAPRGPSNQK